MKIIVLLSFSLSCLFFVGCDPAVGPVLVNKAGRDLIVVVDFRDGKSINGVTQKEKVWWLGYNKSPIKTLRVFDGPKLIHDLNENDLATFKASGDNSLLILVIEISTVRTISRATLNEIP